MSKNILGRMIAGAIMCAALVGGLSYAQDMPGGNRNKQAGNAACKDHLKLAQKYIATQKRAIEVLEARVAALEAERP